MKLNLAGHVLIYTQNKDEFLKQIPEYFSINSELNQSKDVLSKIKENVDRNMLNEIFLIIDTENKEDLLNLEEIFNKGGGLGLRVIIFATDKKSFKEKISKDVFSMVKDNIHTVITQK